MNKKVIFNYDEVSGLISDANGLTALMFNMKPFNEEITIADNTIKLTQLGVSPDDIIKLKTQELL